MLAAGERSKYDSGTILHAILYHWRTTDDHRITQYIAASAALAPDSPATAAHHRVWTTKPCSRAIELIERHYETISNLTGVHFVLYGWPARAACSAQCVVIRAPMRLTTSFA